MDKVSTADIETLIELFDGSDWSELKLSLPGFEMHLSKDASRRASSAAGGAAPAAGNATATAPPAAQSPAAPTTAEVEVPDGHALVRAPNLGTFYRSSKPGAKPYVAIGETVEPDSEVCLIEVMKLFTTVRAGLRGTLRQVLVEDGQMVEFDQPLLLIELDN